MTDKQNDPQPKKPRKPAAKKVPAKKAAPAKKAPAKKVAPAPAKPTPPAAKKAPAKKKRIQNPPPKNNTPSPPGKKAAARKVAAKKAVTNPAKLQDNTKDKENAAKAVSALLGAAKRAVGRPTVYSDDLIPQMLAYFNIETERIEEGEPIKDKEGNPLKDREGNLVLEKKVVVNKYPTLERFASKIGVSRDTLHHWATAKLEDGTPLHPEFSDTYTRCKDLATALLVEGGLEGNYEARIVQFALKNIAGWRDQIDTHVEGTITSASKEDLDAIYARGMEQSRIAAQEAKARAAAGIVATSLTQAIVRRADEDEDDEHDD